MHIYVLKVNASRKQDEKVCAKINAGSSCEGMAEEEVHRDKVDRHRELERSSDGRSGDHMNAMSKTTICSSFGWTSAAAGV